MRSVDLAWALAASLDEQLDISLRSLVYVRLGAGDNYGAIRALIAVAAHNRVPLPRHLIDALLDWRAAYPEPHPRLSVITSIPALRPAPGNDDLKVVKTLTPRRLYVHVASTPRVDSLNGALGGQKHRIYRANVVIACQSSFLEIFGERAD
jgi:hypothetical protein